MRVLVRKMSSLGLLRMQLIIGIIVTGAGFIGLPVGIMVVDITLMQYPITWGIVAIGMLFFAFAGYIRSIRPYILYRRTPDVQVEADGEFLYIHGKKEAKIPLTELEDTSVDVDLPYIYQKEFLDEILVHMFSERYGDIELYVPNYGTYKLRFVSQVEDTGDELFKFIYDIVNSN